MRCKKCLQEKTADRFYRTETTCKDCRGRQRYEKRRESRLRQGLTTNFPTLATRHLASEGMKYCPRCKEIKSLQDFSTMRVRSGVASHCKSCSNVLSKERNATPKAQQQRKQQYQRDKRQRRDYLLRKSFDISIEEYEQMLQRQGGMCLICQKPEQSNKTLAVDHCHTTGRVRGLLCGKCNPAIGFLGDDVQIAERIISYLKGELT